MSEKLTCENVDNGFPACGLVRQLQAENEALKARNHGAKLEGYIDAMLEVSDKLDAMKSWTPFDPDDESTWPEEEGTYLCQLPDAQHVLLFKDGGFKPFVVEAWMPIPEYEP